MLVTAIIHALSFSLFMTWEILWALILGFLISAAVQAVVSKSEMAGLLRDDSLKSVSLASLFGIASSSCSYAAVAIARSIFRKGANFSAAIAFQFASTNLVIELGILLAILLAWQFTLAEFVGGFLMIGILTVIFRRFLSKKLIDEAKQQADKGLWGQMEGHAEMDMSVTKGPLLQRISSEKGMTAISHYFFMDISAIWFDIVLGLVLAGVLSALVPESFWRGFFLVNNQNLAVFWGPLVGPLIAVVSFVCSIGNVPLAVVLWNGGISFGGVIAFIFADLIILPILNIYRKYYGLKMTVFLFATSYIAMVVSALIVEFIFSWLKLIPERSGKLLTAGVSFNYTTILNLAFLIIVGFLLIRFLKSGGPRMLAAMNQPMPMDHGHHQHHH